MNTGAYVGNPVQFVDPLGLAPPCTCAKRIKEIESQIALFDGDRAKYDPIKDAQGGFKMRGGKLTKPCGHYMELTDMQRGLKNKLEAYRECKCEKREGRPAVERQVILEAQQRRFEQLVVPPGCSPIAI